MLVTGACGTVGRELLVQLLRTDVGAVVGLDNNESELFFLQRDLLHDPRVEVHLGDVRELQGLLRRFEGVDIVLHTAALKHVHLCEDAPHEALNTNILGVQNVIDAATATGVDRVVFTSSDKAVNPTTVMGTSKLMGERLLTAAQQLAGSKATFVSTRFGNVLGSRGSVIPLFQRQIRSGGPVTLTDPRMTRFIMTLAEAVRLVMESVFLARGGEVFVTKMQALRIADLGRAMLDLLAPALDQAAADIEIVETGMRPGEKLYEELVSDEETRRTVELERYYVVMPPALGKAAAGYPGLVRRDIRAPYSSDTQPHLTREQIAEYLTANHLIAAPPTAPLTV